jgi:hypothetical protein
MKWRTSSSIVPSALAPRALLALLTLAQASSHGATPASSAPSALPRPCPLPGSPPNPAAARDCVPVTPAVPRTPTGTGAGAGAGAVGGAGGRGGGGAGGRAGAGTGGGSGASQPPPLADVVLPAGPFIVKQIETLGGESISGGVCRLGDAFVVNFVTPKVAFSAQFTPGASALTGNVSYAYSIPGAGESHNAQGSYTGQPDRADGAVHITMIVSDHVVFKGFDGNIPNRYKFDLASTPGGTCPPHQ